MSIIPNTKIFTHAKTFKDRKNFKPCPAEDGEEVYANGIFKFNISKMILYIQNNPAVFTPKTVVVNEIYTTSPHINEDRFMDDFDPEHFYNEEINQQLKEWKAVWMNKWE